MELAHYAPLAAAGRVCALVRIFISRFCFSRMFRPLITLILLGLFGSGSGCAMGRPAVAGNPIFVPARNEDSAWEGTVDVVHDYFDIARENRILGSQPGIIETRYRIGASVLEPWHHDSHGLNNRVESTLQSIRRKAIISLTPAEGGYLVSVEVFKEIE